MKMSTQLKTQGEMNTTSTQFKTICKCVKICIASVQIASSLQTNAWISALSEKQREYLPRFPSKQPKHISKYTWLYFVASVSYNWTKNILGRKQSCSIIAWQDGGREIRSGEEIGRGRSAARPGRMRCHILGHGPLFSHSLGNSLQICCKAAEDATYALRFEDMDSLLQTTTVWLQQIVRSSCWSSMFNGIWPEPTNKRFNSEYL